LEPWLRVLSTVVSTKDNVDDSDEAEGGQMNKRGTVDDNEEAANREMNKGRNIDDSDEVEDREMNKRRKIVDDEESISKGDEGTVHKEKPCIMCGYTPCVFLQEYDTVMDICMMHEMLGKSNKQICFELYRYMVRVIYGYLGKGERKKLPECVIQEIHDHCPNPDGEDYVGFRKNGSH
jgi:hypothetical protein